MDSATKPRRTPSEAIKSSICEVIGKLSELTHVVVDVSDGKDTITVFSHKKNIPDFRFVWRDSIRHYSVFMYQYVDRKTFDESVTMPNFTVKSGFASM